MQPSSTSSTAEVSSLVAPDPPARPVFIGIDWADQTHAICLIDPERSAPQHSSLNHKPEAIAAWAEALHKKYAGRELCLIIETSKGSLITALIEVGGFTIYPINPKQAARYREALHPTGSKSDPADAQLLVTFLMHHRDSLRALQPDTPETRKLAELTQLRRTQVEERKRITLQLRSLLQKYFPLILDLFQDQLDEPLVIDLLKRWPSLLLLKRVNPSLLNTFLKEHGIRSEDRREELVKHIRAAVDLTRDKALIEPLALRAQCLAKLLEVLVRSIAEFDSIIAQAVTEHEDAPIFKSLPGAGPALVPRLIVAFGSDRDRFQSATELQNQSGIAPVTQQSGKAKSVHSRHACPQFLKQTFHEFADHSRRWSPWAKAFYQSKKASGMKHQAAVRALAFKWIRILFQMWKHRKPYDANHYSQALIQANSPLAKLLPHTASQNPEITKNVT
jgi:transposase